MKKRLISGVLSLFMIIGSSAYAQILTREDSLTSGLIQRNSTTVISGYGQAKVEYDLRFGTGNANLTRNVLFLGHKFNNKISFFSEMELENAKVEGGEAGGELAMEQLFLKFNLNKDHYLVAGLFIPRIGIINENHLPTTFNGNDRTYVETFIIPSTWRELGVGVYGNINQIQGLNYSFAVLNGLNSAGFRNGSGIREGKFEGSNATASNLAVTGALLYYINNFRIQASGYYGGSAGLVKREADSLQVDYGNFGTPVALGELNIQYLNNGFSFKTLGAAVSIPDASKINRAYASNTPEMMIGGYAEIGYDLIRFFKKDSEKNLTVFGRYEYMDMNYKIPDNGIKNGLLEKQFIVAGLSYIPVRGVIVKADYVHRTTGDLNPALVINPFPQQQKYYTTNGFINLGIGYSF
jgi:hypothetical protein